MRRQFRSAKDQMPMLEQTKEIVHKFNAVYGETLTDPQILLPDNKACLRLPGTDGKAKMSKSLGNCIYLSESEADVKKKIMSMFTDPIISGSKILENSKEIPYLPIWMHSVRTGILRNICRSMRTWMS